MVTVGEVVRRLEELWPENKAKGLLAQIRFRSEMRSGYLSRYGDKFFEGCWLLAPRREDFFRFRFCFFVHGRAVDAASLRDELEPASLMDGHWRFHMVAGFLRKAGMGVFYAVPSGNPLAPEWRIYRYEKERLLAVDARVFFGAWPGTGRPSGGRGWSGTLREEFLNLSEEDLLSMLLNELFYTDFVKGRMRKPVSDPYDVDGFLLSYGGAVLPVEIKEKFPAPSQSGSFFGIDAGRLFMLLRLCLPNDSNAVYLIREVGEKDRTFVGWKFMLLSEIIVTASWNLQRGGRGMGGQETQTVRLPYSCFRRFDAGFLSEEGMEAVKNLPDEIKRMASEFGRSLEELAGAGG